MQGAVVAAFRGQETIGGQLDGCGIEYTCGMVSGGASRCETVIRLLLGCTQKCTNSTVLSIKEYNVGPIKTHSIGTDGTTGYL